MGINAMHAMKLLVVGFAAVALAPLAGCGRGESRITNTRLTDTAAPPSAEAAAPLEIESVALEARTDPDAHPRDWVECVGGQLEWPGGRVEACKERERAWVDPERDEVTIVVTADGALIARAKVAAAPEADTGNAGVEVEAPFVDGRARLRVKLRGAFGALSAKVVSERVAVSIELEVESQSGDAKGSVRLETPRVVRLVEGAVGEGVAFAVAGERRGSIFLGPEPARLPPNPDVPVALIERVVLDVGVPRLALPCAAQGAPSILRGGRLHRPVHLRVFELASGRVVGERVLGADAPPCGEAFTVGPDEVANAVEVLVAGGPSEALEDYAGWPVKDPMPLLRLQRFLGLARGASAEAVGAALGVSGGGPWLGDGAVSALVTERGLEEVRVVGKAGVDILKSKKLDGTVPGAPGASASVEEPLLSLLDEPLEVVLGALGRPNFHGRGFAIWTVDQGSLTIFAELRCEAEGERRCRELRVGSVEGKDPHEGGDVPGAKQNPHSHRHPNDDGHGHGHGHSHNHNHDHEDEQPDSQP